MNRIYNEEYQHLVLPEVNVDADMVKQILETCTYGATIVKLTKNIRDLPYYILKKYLFYLVTFGLISYRGKGRLYKITDKGYELLLIINDFVANPNSTGEDIVIYN
jgi:predicted transcriptional regulator